MRKIDSDLHQITLATGAPFSPEALSGILIRSGWASATTLKVAYSGGLDSTVLLHALAGLRPAHGWRLEAVHVQHGLHPQAEAWLDQCRRFCQVLSVPLRVERARIGSTADTGLEAAARHARYACLAA
ncbi:MAG: ATP-binding protein, partial [Pseudomonadota bacterium]